MADVQQDRTSLTDLESAAINRGGAKWPQWCVLVQPIVRAKQPQPVFRIQAKGTRQFFPVQGVWRPRRFQLDDHCRPIGDPFCRAVPGIGDYPDAAPGRRGGRVLRKKALESGERILCHLAGIEASTNAESDEARKFISQFWRLEFLP